MRITNGIWSDNGLARVSLLDLVPQGGTSLHGSYMRSSHELRFSRNLSTAFVRIFLFNACRRVVVLARRETRWRCSLDHRQVSRSRCCGSLVVSNGLSAAHCEVVQYSAA